MAKTRLVKIYTLRDSSFNWSSKELRTLAVMQSESCAGVFLATAQIKVFAGRRLIFVTLVIRYICLLFFLASVSRAAVVPVDSIVAIVGEDVITSSELDLEVARTVANFRTQGQSVPDSNAIRGQVLEKLITLKA